MNEKSSVPPDAHDDASLNSAKAADAFASRRRLIRAGAGLVPVVSTLASRPAHAWQCRSPSAWGSLKANANTSLKNNAGHRAYTDETWTLANWKNNTARSATGYSAKPWVKLCENFSTIVTKETKTQGSFDHTKVTVSMLQAVMGIQVPSGLNPSVKCVDLMGSANFGSCCLAAQLNWILLSPLPKNDLEKCLSLVDLKNMAIGAYPAGSPWTQQQVRTYLTENYIVRAS